MAAPIFKLRRKLASKGCYVIAQWEDGSKTKVGRFTSKEEAERWLRYKSKDWVAQKLSPDAPSLEPEWREAGKAQQQHFAGGDQPDAGAD